MKERTEKQQRKNQQNQKFFEKTNKIVKCSAGLNWLRKKIEKAQIIKIRNERGDITIDLTE